MNKFVFYRFSIVVLLVLFSIGTPVFIPAHGDDTDIDSQAKSTIKVLMIGNSFSRDSATYLADLAKASGKKVVLLNAYHPSCSLEEHAKGIEGTEKNPQSPAARIYTHEGSLGGGESLPKEFNLKEALKADKWDFVTIQQFSVISFKPETYEPFAHQIVDYIHKYAPQAEILVHETWAYREDDPTFADGTFTQQQMYEGLKAAYAKLVDDYHFRLIPVGDAFQAARATARWHYVPDPNFDFKHPAPGTLPDQKTSLNKGWFWDGDKFSSDPHHLSPSGKYLGSCVLYEVFFGESVADVDFCPKELDDDTAKNLRQIAHETAQAQKKNDPSPKTASSSSSADHTEPATATQSGM